MCQRQEKFASVRTFCQMGGRSRSLDALLPVSLPAGVSRGDLQEALTAFSAQRPRTCRPRDRASNRAWQEEYDRWQRRDLSARRYAYIWADGVYLQARMEPEAECILVIIGATPKVKKELIGFHVGTRESAQSWRELLVVLKARGLTIPPELAVGDGAFGLLESDG